MSDAHAALEHYLANALSTDERLAFEAHATSCASCSFSTSGIPALVRSSATRSAG